MAESLLGKKIKSFNVVKLIGEGAYAVVFQAIDDSTNKLVAVKVMTISEFNKSKFFNISSSMKLKKLK